MHKLISFAVSLMLLTTLAAQKTVPSTTVYTIDNKEINLAEYASDGNPKIISLWATWCGPCRMELKELSKVYEGWKKKYGVEIIAVTVDVPSMVKRAEGMFNKNNWAFTFFSDKDGELMNTLGIDGIPYSMLVDGQGNVISTQSGYYSGYEKELESKIKKLKS